MIIGWILTAIGGLWLLAGYLRARELNFELSRELSKEKDKSLPPITIYDLLQTKPINIPCEVPIRITENRSEAHLVVWKAPHVDLNSYNGTEERERNPHQLNAFWSLENSIYYPEIEEARKALVNQDKDAFDLEMTYSTKSDIPTTYAYGHLDYESVPLPFEARLQDKLAAAFISNCTPRNNRSVILEKLMRLLPGQIDSYGHCFKNADVEKAHIDLNITLPGRIDQYWEEKVEIIKHYKFTIAFENADEEDYITEKFFQALASGSIPIHLGMTSSVLEKFKPSPEAALNVIDFPSVESLANRMIEISKDKYLFETMLSWKKKPFTGFFAEAVSWGKVHDFCRFAKFIRNRWANPYAHLPERYPELRARLKASISENR